MTALANALIAGGVARGDRVGLMSRTRYEWTLVDYAIWACGAVTAVPVYDSSNAEQVAWIIEDPGAVACFVETADHRARVASRRATRADDIATIVYPSGMTGRPKGCVLTHRTVDFDVVNALAGSTTTTGKPASATVETLRGDVDLRGEVRTAVDAANLAVSTAEAIEAFRILPREFTEAAGEMTRR